MMSCTKGLPVHCFRVAMLALAALFMQTAHGRADEEDYRKLLTGMNSYSGCMTSETKDDPSVRALIGYGNQSVPFLLRLLDNRFEMRTKSGETIPVQAAAYCALQPVTEKTVDWKKIDTILARNYPKGKLPAVYDRRTYRQIRLELTRQLTAANVVSCNRSGVCTPK